MLPSPLDVCSPSFRAQSAKRGTVFHRTFFVRGVSLLLGFARSAFEPLFRRPGLQPRRNAACMMRALAPEDSAVGFLPGHTTAPKYLRVPHPRYVRVDSYARTSQTLFSSLLGFLLSCFCSGRFLDRPASWVCFLFRGSDLQVRHLPRLQTGLQPLRAPFLILLFEFFLKGESPCPTHHHNPKPPPPRASLLTLGPSSWLC